MLGRENKLWIHFRRDIIAADVSTALFLSTFLRSSIVKRSYANHLEVIDLQRYKVISGNRKVRTALRDKIDTPFVFVVGKN